MYIVYFLFCFLICSFQRNAHLSHCNIRRSTESNVQFVILLVSTNELINYLGGLFTVRQLQRLRYKAIGFLLSNHPILNINILCLIEFILLPQPIHHYYSWIFKNEVINSNKQYMMQNFIKKLITSSRSKRCSI